MTGQTSVPQPIFGPNGFVPPDAADIFTGVMADMNAAFGGNLDTDPETPQGQWATSLTAEINAQNEQFLVFVNGVDPALNSGRMQDAIGRIYFLSRIAAAPTSVECTCIGLAGTQIPTGALALNESDGNQYFCTAGGTIPPGGSISLPFSCVATGPISCPATALATIYQAIPGWDTISNPADGVLGRNVETAAEFEARREASVALNARAILSSVRANVLQVPDVLDCYVTENDTASPTTIGGVTIGANSLYVCVAGGAAQAIAQAIWEKKPPGCAYTGNTTETVYDENSGYNEPFPSYSVTFEAATDVTILFAVTIKNNPTVPANVVQLIQNAIANAFVGDDGGPAATIGSTIFALRFVAPLAALGPWLNLVSITLGSINTPGASFTGVIAGTALSTSSVTGTIAIGQTVIGAGIPDGTVIQSGSGSSWVINNSLTISSEAMISVAPSLADITMNINQAPVIDPVNVAVTLA